MSFKAEVLSPDLQKQIELLEKFPQIVEREYRPAMQRVTEIVEARIAVNTPSNRAKSELGSRIEGSGINITGIVGFFGSFWQVNILEYGASAHLIPKGNAKRPIRLPDGWVTGPVQHPGFGARHFMATGFAASKQIVEAVFGQANERIVEQLSVESGGVNGD